jgi:hypothetical protein
MWQKGRLSKPASDSCSLEVTCTRLVRGFRLTTSKRRRNPSPKPNHRWPAHGTMAKDTFTLLRESGTEISKAICIAAGGLRLTPSEACYSIAHDVAVGLHLISEYLGSLPPYWIGPDVEELCRSLLQDLLDITTVSSASFRLTVQDPGATRRQPRPRNTSITGRQGTPRAKLLVIHR